MIDGERRLHLVIRIFRQIQVDEICVGGRWLSMSNVHIQLNDPFHKYLDIWTLVIFSLTDTLACDKPPYTPIDPPTPKYFTIKGFRSGHQEVSVHIHQPLRPRNHFRFQFVILISLHYGEVEKIAESGQLWGLISPQFFCRKYVKYCSMLY